MQKRRMKTTRAKPEKKLEIFQTKSRDARASHCISLSNSTATNKTQQKKNKKILRFWFLCVGKLYVNC